jgi:hypothetical protein
LLHHDVGLWARVYHEAWARHHSPRPHGIFDAVGRLQSILLYERFGAEPDAGLSVNDG